MSMLVLCGGRGTRLGAPIKCLAPVAGRLFMDWKLDQLEALGVSDILLACGPFRDEFARRYGSRAIYESDPQLGISAALDSWDSWWTWGDTLLDQSPVVPGSCYVTSGTHIAGLWLDVGLYHGPGPWNMVETDATPYHINTPVDLEVTSAYLHRLSTSR